MSQRDKIRKILKEESYSPNVRDNFALGVLKFIYGRIYNYISTETDMDVKVWPGETLNDFINILSDDIKEDADDVLQIVFDGVTEKHNPLLSDIPQKEAIKWMYEFIFNYKNSGKRVGFDVVSDNDVYWYMRDRLFNCDDNFFQYVWDVFISDRSNYWNEQLKDRFWGEIEDEVIEKMEDEEWQEENGVTFDSLEREKSYFKTYWHYPIDSLGWDRDQLCDYYRDILESKDRDTLYKVLKHYKTPKKQQIFLGDTFYWVIDENLFY